MYVFRVEVAGGHTGSAYCYYSYLTPKREEIDSYLHEHWCNEQSTLALIVEGFTAKAELLDDGVCKSSVDLRPAMTFHSGEHQFTFHDGYWWWGELCLEEDSLFKNEGKYLDMVGEEMMMLFCNESRLTMDWSAVELVPAGRPASEGEVIQVTTSRGKVHSQEIGKVVGDFCQG